MIENDKIYQMFSEIKEKLKVPEQSAFDNLISLFDDLCFLIISFFIPFTLQSISKEKEYFLEEVKDCKDYVSRFFQLLRFLKSFDKWLLSKPIESKDNQFSLKIDQTIKEVVDFYDSIVISGPQNQVRFINQSYSSFLLISRVLNTAIKLYNKEFSDYQIKELENIPIPKCLNLDNVTNLKNYIDEVYNNKEALFPISFLEERII